MPRQGDPVRNTHSIPSNFPRLSLAFRPAFPGSPNRKGRAHFHCRSLITRLGPRCFPVPHLSRVRQGFARWRPAPPHCQQISIALSSARACSRTPVRGSGAAAEARISRGSVCFHRGPPKPRAGLFRRIVVSPALVYIPPPCRRKAGSRGESRNPQPLCTGKSRQTTSRRGTKPPATTARKARLWQLLDIYLVRSLRYHPLAHSKPPTGQCVPNRPSGIPAKDYPFGLPFQPTDAAEHHCGTNSRLTVSPNRGSLHHGALQQLANRSLQDCRYYNPSKEQQQLSSDKSAGMVRNTYHLV